MEICISSLKKQKPEAPIDPERQARMIVGEIKDIGPSIEEEEKKEKKKKKEKRDREGESEEKKEKKEKTEKKAKRETQSVRRWHIECLIFGM